MADIYEQNQPPRTYPLYKTDGSVPDQLGFQNKWRGYHKDNVYSIAATTKTIINLDVADLNGVVAAVNLGALGGRKPFLFVPKFWSIVLDGSAFPAAAPALFHGASWFLWSSIAPPHPLMGDSPYAQTSAPIGFTALKFDLPSLLYNTFSDFRTANDYLQNILLDASLNIENTDAAAHNITIHQYLLFDIIDVPADYMMAPR